jgi:hypothetical protein
MSAIIAAPLSRGEASNASGGFWFSENQPPTAPSAHAPLDRGAA